MTLHTYLVYNGHQRSGELESHHITIQTYPLFFKPYLSNWDRS